MESQEWQSNGRYDNFESYLSHSSNVSYPNADIDCSLSEIREQFSEISEDETSDRMFTLAGRVTRKNDFNDLYFLDIEDETGAIQIQADSEFTDNLDDFSTVDIGDIVEVEGEIMLSDTGEFTIHTVEMRLLSKAFTHPPSYDGFGEEETVRNRAMAIQYDSELQESIRTRFLMQQEIRSYLTDNGYLEVETPILQNAYAGGEATPFETESVALDEDLYLRIAPEIALKKLVAGGFENIFEMGKVFRNEDIDTTHNPEFTMLELYEAYADYEDMMELTRDLITSVVEEVTGGTTITYDGEEIDFSTWNTVSLITAVDGWLPETVSAQDESDVVQFVNREYSDSVESQTEALMKLFEEELEAEYTQPTFVVDYPYGSSPLCKNTGEMQERFELIINGVELANAYTEQINPLEQENAFVNQHGENHQLDNYVKSLAGGMPPTGGLGIGIDRLAMLLTNSDSIKQVLPFPMTRTEMKR